MPKVTQEQALEELLGSNNCFLTGAGGCGKSYIINKLMQIFEENGVFYNLTASTGIAAQHIGGKTIHSFAGLGIKFDVDEITSSGYWRSKIAPELNKLDALIIDEISMLGAQTFSLLDEVMQIARRNSRPFGGCKMIIVGDPFQLPPVKDDFFFISESYWNANFTILNLTKNYRAMNLEWNDILRKIRVGLIDEDVTEMFYQRSRVKAPKECVRMVSTNYEADKINKEKLSLLSTPSKKFYYSVKDKYGILGSKGSAPYKRAINDFFKFRLIKREIELKIGAQVMIVVNDVQQDQYVNGTCGEVVHMEDSKIVVELKKKLLDNDGNVVYDENNLPIMVADRTVDIPTKYPFPIEKKIKNPDYGKVYKDDLGRELIDDRETIIAEATVNALPVILAYGITVHKCLLGNTLVKTQDRGMIPLKDIEIGESIYNGETYTKCLNKVNTGKKTINKLTTKCGYEISGSEDHPIMTYDEEGFHFVNIGDLKKDDIVCIDRTPQTTKGVNPELKYVDNYEDLGYFLGSMVGDGNYSQWNALAVSSKDQEILDFYKKMGFTRHVLDDVKCDRMYLSDAEMRKYFEDLGLGKFSSTDKDVPHSVLSGSLEYKKGFLSGLFDADGSCTKNPHRNIRLVSICRHILQKVQLLLLDFGIISYIGKMKKYSKSHNQAYCLYISGTSFDKFSNIGFRVGYKQDRFLDCVNGRLKNKTSKDFIPYGGKIKDRIRELFRENGIVQRKYKNIRSAIGNEYKLTYYHLEYLLAILEENGVDIPEDLQYFRERKFFFDTVENITICGEEEMFDLEIEDIHSFWANGFITHNCQGLTLDAARIDLRKGFEEGQAYVALSRVKSAEGVYLDGTPADSSLEVNQDVIDFVKFNISEFKDPIRESVVDVIKKR